MRGLNLAVLIAGLLMVGAALYGFGGMDGSLKLAASHTAPAPHGPCHHHDGDGDGFTPGV
jgi:hypothetical protein